MMRRRFITSFFVPLLCWFRPNQREVEAQIHVNELGLRTFTNSDLQAVAKVMGLDEGVYTTLAFELFFTQPNGVAGAAKRTIQSTIRVTHVEPTEVPSGDNNSNAK